MNQLAIYITHSTYLYRIYASVKTKQKVCTPFSFFLGPPLGAAVVEAGRCGEEAGPAYEARGDPGWATESGEADASATGPEEEQSAEDAGEPALATPSGVAPAAWSMQRDCTGVPAVSVRVPVDGSKEITCSSAIRSIEPVVLPLLGGRGGFLGGAKRIWDGGDTGSVESSVT